ncbi:hypothetical protein LTS18_005055, partial [Coniosporium uncinatum]
MGRSPAVIIIARHGARLDAADPEWQFSSPTPYDPPLTYGGWNQARALGVRIASLLHAREEALDDEEIAASLNNFAFNGADDPLLAQAGISQPPPDRDGKKPKRRKQKVVVHASPFLRCVQTSIGVSAGMSQYNPSEAHFRHLIQNNKSSKRRSLSQSPRLHAADKDKDATRQPTQAELDEIAHLCPSIKNWRKKRRLRVDAFLGEWLSPSYFEGVTAPPDSRLMIASAKAELLRPGEAIPSTVQNANLAKGNFPGGWTPGGVKRNSSVKEEASSRPDFGRRDRTSSHGREERKRPLASHIQPESRMYNAPTPAYRVIPNDPIPSGYVTHARDACVEADI